jgi:membrane protein required for beta-lactamase induction
METLNKIATAFTAIILLVLVITIPVMLLWNWLMPDIFGLPTITFWQAMGLSALGNFLFGTSKN